MKIATILPYKENYTIEKASAASLWVSEFFKKSKYKKNNFIYGHTKSKNFLTSNYKNINLKNLKSKVKSTKRNYIDLTIIVNQQLVSLNLKSVYLRAVKNINMKKML